MATLEQASLQQSTSSAAGLDALHTCAQPGMLSELEIVARQASHRWWQALGWV